MTDEVTISELHAILYNIEAYFTTYKTMWLTNSGPLGIHHAASQMGIRPDRGVCTPVRWQTTVWHLSLCP